MALVGVIIPTWNNPEYLIPCVTSIINKVSVFSLVDCHIVHKVLNIPRLSKDVYFCL